MQNLFRCVRCDCHVCPSVPCKSEWIDRVRTPVADLFDASNVRLTALLTSWVRHLGIRHIHIDLRDQVPSHGACRETRWLRSVTYSFRKKREKALIALPNRPHGRRQTWIDGGWRAGERRKLGSLEFRESRTYI